MTKLRTVNIKGKEYVMVNERLKYFREHYPDFRLVTDWLKMDDSQCCAKAKILNADGAEVANGTAFEEKQTSYINKTSYIENCETSAWGRALANFGIGIDDSVGSADEVAHAMAIQEQQKKPKPKSQNKAAAENLPFPEAEPEDALEDIEEKILKDLRAEIKEKADMTSTPVESICKNYNKPDLQEFTMSDCYNAIKILDLKLKKQEKANA